ncbi:low-density lipoprotein receptor-related protein 8-like [Dendronephthya gigantea]|uniref:low-density lipoprotein receptor-related protein 8-like n=1 Tax=Dendronephthya gigantea TaxID=151771 RepID=UPI0010697C25|nr:low-density lipoprotein receptor-related protein 8-like [Dendronephthya gigantea]
MAKSKARVFWQFFVLFIVVTTNDMVFGRRDFGCSSDEYECSKTQTCTRLKWRCDGEDDCFDGEDELNCPPTTCRPGYFKCRNGRCIENSWVCDRHHDCPDKDDEAPIQQCARTTCSPNDFQCRNGDCIQGSYRCDREHDCEDESDEDGCPELVCESTEMKCANNLTCISHNRKCNGVYDCVDQSDENDCPATCNAATEFTCDDGDCFPKSFRCDRDRDCTDGSDEAGCPTRPTSAPCPNHRFQCNDGECIPATWQCDGTPDCNDHSDENSCPPTCTSTQFTCVRSGKCIFLHSKCDGIADCSDKSDEANCESQTSCDEVNGLYRCESSYYCINESQLCNGLRECPRGDDEATNCGINECADHNGHCVHNCTDFPIGYKCSCKKGYKLANDKRSCDDVNECDGVYGSCSQTCLNLKGSFRCGCVEGYLLSAATGTCRAKGPHAYLAFGGEHAIHNLTTSGNHYGSIVSNRKAPIAVDYDLKNGYVYWSDILDEKIERTRLSGDGTVETVVDKLVHSNGLAIDWVGRKLYWTDETSKSIEVSELDGRNRLTLFEENLEAPRGVGLDPFLRYIFWTDWSVVHPKIERASMDGESRKIVLDANLEWPTALTVDTIVKRLFFAETKLQRIESITYDGFERRTIISKGLVHPLGLAVFEDHLYYTDYSLNKIFTVDRRSGKRLGILKDNVKRPTGISVVHPVKQKKVATKCNIQNGGCSHLCLLSSNSSRNFTCRCPTGMVLRDDGKSCSPSGNQTSEITPALNTKKPESTAQSPRGTKGQTNAKGTTENKGPLAKKHEGSSGKSGPLIAGVTVAVIVGIFLLVGAVLYWRRRARMTDRSILFYKDSSTTPLQNDFDEDLIKSHEDIPGNSRVQFT